MTTDEAREIQREVMRMAQAFKTRDGEPQLTSRNVNEAYFVMYNNLDTGNETLAEWKRNVIKTSMGSSNGLSKPGFLYRYADLAMRRDHLPDDEFLEEAWGAGKGTFSSIRNRLKKRGFDFRVAEGKAWKVTARPQPEPKPVAIVEERSEKPIVMFSTPPSEAPAFQRVEKLALPSPFFEVSSAAWTEAPTITGQLDTIIGLLRELLDVWKR